MSYLGYQVKIGTLKLPYPDGVSSNVLENDSLSFKKEKRLVGEWQDGNGEIHHETYPGDKVTIEFTIKSRTMEQQQMLHPLLESRDNIDVEYWDDIEAEYRIGKFFIDEIDTITSWANKDAIYYNPLTVKLEEY